MSVEFKDNSSKVKSEFDEALLRGLEKVGLVALAVVLIKAGREQRTAKKQKTSVAISRPMRYNKARDILNQTAAALGGSFVPADRFETKSH